MSKSVADYKYDFFKSLVDGLGPVLFGTINTNQVNGVPAVQSASDLLAYGEQTSPGIGTNITAAPVNLTAGTWDLYVQYNASGTTAGLDRANIGLKIGAGSPIVMIATTGGTTDNSIPIRYVSAGATAVNIVSIAAATVGAVYRAAIIAKRVA
jgi:hypothetical protein